LRETEISCEGSCNPEISTTKGNTVDQNSTPPDPRRLITNRETCTMLGGVSLMTLWRWSQNPAFGIPTPVKIAGRNYRVYEEVTACRERLIAGQHLENGQSEEA
jgi:hypothetical protein